MRTPIFVTSVFIVVTSMCAFASNEKTGKDGKLCGGVLAKTSSLSTVGSNVPTVSFRDKFERQKSLKSPSDHAFNSGEVISGTFMLENAHDSENHIDRSKIRLRFDDGRIDVRHTDSFIIDIDPNEFGNYQQMLGTRFNGSIRIKNPIKKDYVISNMYDYTGELVSPLESTGVVNPDASKIAKLPDESQVVLEGKLISFQPGDYKTPGVVTLQTPEGTIIKAATHSMGLAFKGSGNVDYENIDRKPIEPGDQVRVMGFTKNGGIHTGYFETAVLIEPNSQRRQSYSQLRTTVHGLLASLNSSSQQRRYSQARSVFAQLMKLEMTEAERKAITEMLNGVPSNEKPLLFWTRYELDVMNSGFGSEYDFDRMTIAEFRSFSEGFADGKIRPLLIEKKYGDRSGTIDQSYLYRLFRHLNMPVEFQIDIMSRVIRSRLAYFVARWKSGHSYNHDVDFDNNYTLEQTLNYISRMESETTIIKLAELTRQFVVLGNQGFSYASEFEHVFINAIRNAKQMAEKAGHPEWLRHFQGVVKLPGDNDRKLLP